MSQDSTKKPLTIQEFASLGGKARAKKLGKERVNEITKKARDARKCYKNLVKATHDGEIIIGDKTILCAVLEDGTRVITQSSMQTAIGRSRGGIPKTNGEEQLPVFIAYESLKPFITKDLTAGSRPIKFRMKSGGIAHGFKAELLPEVCEVYLKARDCGALPHNQYHIARQCDIIMRALAKVGIVALIDARTGYEKEREKDELQKLLSKYINADLLPWTRRFSPEFFDAYKRMYGVDTDKHCPAHIGHLINKYVYDELAPGVLDELRSKNPIQDNGKRKNAHHQWLSEDTGIPALDKQLIKVTTIMNIADNKDDFKKFYEKSLKHDII